MSKKVLYITANPKTEEESFGLQVGREFIQEYKQQNPMDELTELNLFETDVPLLSATAFDAFGVLQNGGSLEELSTDQKSFLGSLNLLLEQFIAADAYIFVSPLWNFSIPPVLKAYIDVILQAGKTFHYTENGPEGLLKGKKAIHIQASGGIYSNGNAVEMEFGHRYLKTVLGFIGISDLKLIPVEGVAMGNLDVNEIVKSSSEKARVMATEF